ncbi:MAG TPA: Hsp20/alpha crystallin family protein [Gemmatimonadales bacterium]|nr:Hsp20/alpha crystallin family protein [Gemmatimonadales bacterium]
MARNPLSPFRSGGLAERGGYGGDPFLSLHREMNRLFDDVLRGSFGVPVQSGEQGGGMMMPHMDVSETENEVRICAELPGVSEKDVDVSLSDDVLTIRGEKKFERKDDKENYHFVERSYGTFQRSLRLPYAVDPDQVQASFENGVLAVTLPKGKEQERSRRIQVIGSSGQASQGEQNQKARKGSSSSRGGPTS